MSEIPENAKRVYKGVIFEVWQWDQKMFDGTTETFEIVKRPDTVQVIATTGDKVLITKEIQPGHTREPGLLGGMVNEGEDPLAAAKREFLEEAGMESDDWELFTTNVPIVKMGWTIYFYIARNCRKVAEPNREPGEQIEMKEVSFEEFVELFAKDKFWGEFSNQILRLKLDGKLDELKQKLFP